MHEYSVLQSLLTSVEATVDDAISQRGSSRAGAASADVRSIEVRIGELSGVEVELLRRAWTLFEDDARWGGTELRIETVPTRFSCPGCQRDFERGQILRCPDCELPARMIQGDEIVLQRIEMDLREASPPVSDTEA